MQGKEKEIKSLSFSSKIAAIEAVSGPMKPDSDLLLKRGARPPGKQQEVSRRRVIGKRGEGHITEAQEIYKRKLEVALFSVLAEQLEEQGISRERAESVAKKAADTLRKKKAGALQRPKEARPFGDVTMEEEEEEEEGEGWKKSVLDAIVEDVTDDLEEEDFQDIPLFEQLFEETGEPLFKDMRWHKIYGFSKSESEHNMYGQFGEMLTKSSPVLFNSMPVNKEGHSLLDMMHNVDITGQLQWMVFLLMAEVDEILIESFQEAYTAYRTAMTKYYTAVYCNPPESVVVMGEVRETGDRMFSLLMDIIGMDKDHPYRNPFFANDMLTQQAGLFAGGIDPLDPSVLSQMNVSEIFFERFPDAKEDPIQVAYLQEMQETFETEAKKRLDEKELSMIFEEERGMKFLDENTLSRALREKLLDSDQLAQIYDQPLGRKKIEEHLASLFSGGQVTPVSTEGDSALSVKDLFHIERKGDRERSKIEEYLGDKENVLLESQTKILSRLVIDSIGAKKVRKGKERVTLEEEDEEEEEEEEEEFERRKKARTIGSSRPTGVFEGDPETVVKNFMDRINRAHSTGEHAITFDEAMLIVEYYKTFEQIEHTFERLQSLGYTFPTGNTKVLAEYQTYKANISGKLGVAHLAAAFGHMAGKEERSDHPYGHRSIQAMNHFFTRAVKKFNSAFDTIHDDNEREDLLKELEGLKNPVTGKNVDLDIAQGITNVSVGVFENKQISDLLSAEVDVDEVSIKEMEYLNTHRKSPVRELDPKGSNSIKRLLKFALNAMERKDNSAKARTLRLFVNGAIAPLTMRGVQMGLAWTVAHSPVQVEESKQTLEAWGSSAGRFHEILQRDLEKKNEDLIRLASELHRPARSVPSPFAALPSKSDERPSGVGLLAANITETGIGRIAGSDNPSMVVSKEARDSHVKYTEDLRKNIMWLVSSNEALREAAVRSAMQQAGVVTPLPAEGEEQDYCVYYEGKKKCVKDLDASLSVDKRVQILREAEFSHLSEQTLSGAMSGALTQIADRIAAYNNFIPEMNVEETAFVWPEKYRTKLESEHPDFVSALLEDTKDTRSLTLKILPVIQRYASIAKHAHFDPKTGDIIEPVFKLPSLGAKLPVLVERQSALPKYPAYVIHALALQQKQWGNDMSHLTSVNSTYSVDIPVGMFSDAIGGRSVESVFGRGMRTISVSFEIQEHVDLDGFTSLLETTDARINGIELATRGGAALLERTGAIKDSDLKNAAILEYLVQRLAQSEGLTKTLAWTNQKLLDAVMAYETKNLATAGMQVASSSVEVLCQGMRMFLDKPFTYAIQFLPGPVQFMAQTGTLGTVSGYVAEAVFSPIYLASRLMVTTLYTAAFLEHGTNATYLYDDIVSNLGPEIFPPPQVTSMFSAESYLSKLFDFSWTGSVFSGIGSTLSVIPSLVSYSSFYVGAVINYWIFSSLKFNMLDNVPFVGKFTRIISKILNTFGFNSAYDLFTLAPIRKLFFFMADLRIRRSSGRLEEVKEKIRESFSEAKRRVEEGEEEGEEGMASMPPLSFNFEDIDIGDDSSYVASQHLLFETELEARKKKMMIEEMRKIRKDKGDVVKRGEEELYLNKHDLMKNALQIEEELTREYLNLHLESFDDNVTLGMKLIGSIVGSVGHAQFFAFNSYAATLLIHPISGYVPTIITSSLAAVLETVTTSSMYGTLLGGASVAYGSVMIAGVYIILGLMGLKIMNFTIKTLIGKGTKGIGLILMRLLLHPVNSVILIKHTCGHAMEVARLTTRVLSGTDAADIHRLSAHTGDSMTCTARETSDISPTQEIKKQVKSVVKHLGTTMYHLKWDFIFIGSVILTRPEVLNFFWAGFVDPIKSSPMARQEKAALEKMVELRYNTTYADLVNYVYENDIQVKEISRNVATELARNKVGVSHSPEEIQLLIQKFVSSLPKSVPKQVYPPYLPTIIQDVFQLPALGLGAGATTAFEPTESSPLTALQLAIRSSNPFSPDSSLYRGVLEQFENKIPRAITIEQAEEYTSGLVDAMTYIGHTIKK